MVGFVIGDVEPLGIISFVRINLICILWGIATVCVWSLITEVLRLTTLLLTDLPESGRGDKMNA
jgi:hypothetical protein